MSTTYKPGDVKYRDDDFDKVTGWPLLAFWLGVLALSGALVVVAAKTLARLAVLVGLL